MDPEDYVYPEGDDLTPNQLADNFFYSLNLSLIHI